MRQHLALLLCGLMMALCLAPAALAAEEEVVTLVYPSGQSILLNGEEKELHAYALKDANGFLTNYVKVRDMAQLLDRTTARFDVTWEEGLVSIQPGKAYRSVNGQENQAPYDGAQPYLPATADTLVDGLRLSLDAFVILDAQGNGSTYYKLRDLGKALDFSVTWLEDSAAIRIDTSIPYRD